MVAEPTLHRGTIKLEKTARGARMDRPREPVHPTEDRLASPTKNPLRKKEGHNLLVKGEHHLDGQLEHLEKVRE